MTLNTIMLQAAQGTGQTGGNLSFIIMMVLIFAVMYFFMIRPQQKRQKELNKFRNSLENGTKVVTAGGIYGTVKEVSEDTVLIEVDNGVKLRIAKSMVMRDPSDMVQK
ncbi:MAG TPA: preprotein translocase subunit YajC [Candidatus Rikenella faecigallinarum]|uniref:Sec translocon accessory complex subunit YajC n=1 Tax=Candidatus Rikenella faecigallinarum TaxID=2838745 RepID=A0A9D1QD21_9BACT|nr:preprotein translocase subunit YajC [Candidatus Rikenella faecigallinarum]